MPRTIHASKPSWAHKVPVSVPKNAHPLVQFFYAKCIKHNYCITAVCDIAGISHDAVYGWRRGVKPRVETIDKVLRVIGYTITPISLDLEKKMYMKARAAKGISNVHQ